MRPTFESDPEYDSIDAYRVDGYSGIAWRVWGWETEPTPDTEWDGILERTGRLVCVMIGDDQCHYFNPDAVFPIAREDYCGVCGQMDCGHDGLEREGVEL